MVFSSLIFIYLFLPACLLLYIPVRHSGWRNGVLIVFSLVFYAWGEPVYILLMLVSVAVNYWMAFLIGVSRRAEDAAGRKPKTKPGMVQGTRHQGKAPERRPGSKQSKKSGLESRARFCLVLAIGVNLGFLCVFKYSGFFVATLNGILPFGIPVPQIALPIGISFYTFQLMSYVIDVYRGDTEVQRHFPRLLLYAALFPQLIAGPIVRYEDIRGALAERRVHFREMCAGLERFVTGLAKKALLANACGGIAERLMNPEGIGGLSVLGAWFGLTAFALQIYFDFSAYSDMAIGMGRMFGFRYRENFNYPYIAESATDFWRRWHISLGAFFRDYVYIPLGGNRRRLCRNLLIVWALTGLWHGASWNFILWGLYWFAFIVLEKRVIGQKLQRLPGVLRHAWLLVVMLLGWVIFYYDDPLAAFRFYGTLFGFASKGFADTVFELEFLNNLFLWLLAVMACAPLSKLVKALYRYLGNKQRRISNVIFVIKYIWIAGLLFVSTAMLVGDSYNPFIYFRF